MTYRVVLQKRVVKALEKINEPDYSKIKAAIFALASNPRPHGYIKLKGRAAFRIRAGDYRIIYEVFDNILLVDIIQLGNRKDVYD